MADLELREVDGKTVVVGVDKDILEKVLRALIPVEPDTPRGMKVGLMFYPYKGHFLCCDTTEGHSHWYVETIDRSKLPRELEGKYTSQVLARQSIDKHADPKTIAKGEEIIERKRLKLSQDKANGRRDPMPPRDEEDALLKRAMKEVLRNPREE